MFKFIGKFFKKEEKVIRFEDTYMGKLVAEKKRLENRISMAEDDELLGLILQQIRAIDMEIDLSRKISQKEGRCYERC